MNCRRLSHPCQENGEVEARRGEKWLSTWDTDIPEFYVHDATKTSSKFQLYFYLILQISKLRLRKVK